MIIKCYVLAERDKVEPLLFIGIHVYVYISKRAARRKLLDLQASGKDYVMFTRGLRFSEKMRR